MPPLWVQTDENKKKPGLDYKLPSDKVPGDWRICPYEGPYSPPANRLDTHLAEPKAVVYYWIGSRLIFMRLLRHWHFHPREPWLSLLPVHVHRRPHRSALFTLVWRFLDISIHSYSLPREIALLPHWAHKRVWITALCTPSAHHNRTTDLWSLEQTQRCPIHRLAPWQLAYWAQGR
jgi:hypothetical protein